MSRCPKCNEEIDAKWVKCPYCEYVRPRPPRPPRQAVRDVAAVRSDIELVGGDGSEQTVADSVVQRSNIRQSTSGQAAQGISDTVAVGSSITQESTRKVAGGIADPSNTEKMFDQLMSIASTQQGIRDSVIQNSVINQVQNITAQFEVRGLEWLICDNSVCRDTLRLTDEQKRTADLESIILTCDKCGTRTPFKKALGNAQEYLSSIGNVFGDIVAQIETGNVKDGRMRSYIFQKDVVDHLATKFMDICHFIHPVISTPYISNHPTDNKAIEYGIYLQEYIEMIMTDSKLTKNPYVLELAGNDEDRAEADSQSLKLRAIAYVISGLNTLYNTCNGVNEDKMCYPETTYALNEVITYFKAAAKTCAEGRRTHPREKFFNDLWDSSTSMASFVTAQRLYTEYSYSPDLFERSASLLYKLQDRVSFSLDHTKHSTVFTSPGKRTLRKKAEEKLRNSAEANRSLMTSWYQDVSMIPDTVGEIAYRYHDMIKDYINAKKRISQMRVCQMLVFMMGALFAYYQYTQDNLPVIFVGIFGRTDDQVDFAIFAALCITFMILGYVANKNHMRCMSIHASFNLTRNHESQSVKTDILMRSFHSIDVVNKLTYPLTECEDYWAYEISNLKWVFDSKAMALMNRLNGIPTAPLPMKKAVVRD